MDNVVIAERFITAIDTEDTQAMREIYATDATVWHDFDRQEQSVNTNIDSLLNLRQAIPSVRWVTTRIEPLPTGFLLTYDLTMTFGERTLAIPACVIATVANDQITRLEEWVNATPMFKYLNPEQLKILAG